MCIAFTRQSPSATPLRATSASIVGVMLMNPRRDGTSNQRCWVRDFTSLGIGDAEAGVKTGKPGA